MQGERKRAQGRAQDIPYQSMSPYHHGMGSVLFYQKVKGIFDNPHMYIICRCTYVECIVISILAHVTYM